MDTLLKSPHLRGGMLYLQVNGRRYDAKGEFTYNLGAPKKTPIIGADAPHGWSTEAQVPFIEGAITDEPGLDVKAFLNATDCTVTLELQIGKVISLSEATCVSDGSVKTKEGEIPVRFEGMSAQEIL